MITVHMKKWFSCVLAALILAAVFASCGEKQDAGNPANHQADPSESVPDAEETEAETEDPLFGSLTSVDLGGETVRASVSCGHADGIAVSSYEYIAGPEELTGESCQDYAYERNSFVENMLNCSLEYDAVDYWWDEVLPYVSQLFMSGETACSYLINDLLGLTWAAQQGYLLDTADRSNFDDYWFDFDSDAYYKDFMLPLCVGPKRFFISGDYFIDTLRSSHVMFLNKNLYADLFGDPNDIYNLVLDKRWTLDAFFEIEDAAYVDTNGNGKKDKEDTFGLTNNAQSVQANWMLYYSTDAHIVDFDGEGNPSFAPNPLERISFVAERLIKINKTKAIWKTGNVPDTRKHFTEGHCVFALFQKIGDIEDDTVREMDGVGVIPCPLADETQDGYRTLVHTSAEVGAILGTVVGKQASAASAVIQVMAVHSHEYLRELYYETALKQKYAQDQMTSRMLDIVVDGIRAPFEYLYMDSYSFDIAAESIQAGKLVVASSYAKREESMRTALDNLIQKYNGQ